MRILFLVNIQCDTLLTCTHEQFKYKKHVECCQWHYVMTVCVFIYQNKTCVQTLEGHAHNVTCVSFHPELPIILTGSEDGGLHILTKCFKAKQKQICSPKSVQHLGSAWPLCCLLRHCSSVALQHLPTRKHTQLRHGEGVVYMWPARLQQCGFWLWWWQHHH